ncbi:MAG: tyrosine-type recombinase/integrase [Henriciella sp.]
MPMKASLRFKRKIASSAREKQRYLQQRKHGVYYYHRRLPKLIAEYFPDAPKNGMCTRTTHTDDIHEARHFRDRLEAIHNRTWLSTLVALERETVPPFALYSDLEEMVADEEFANMDLDEVLIPESVKPSPWHKKQRTPAMTVRDVALETLVDRLEKILPDIRERLEEQPDDEDFYDFASSEEGRALIQQSPEAVKVARDIMQVSGKLSWTQAADKIAAEDPNMAPETQKSLRGTALKLEAMNAPMPHSVSYDAVARVVLQMAQDGLAKSTITQHIKRGKRMTKWLFPRDAVRIAAWDDHKNRGYESDDQQALHPSDVERLLGTQCPDPRVRAAFRIGIYTGARVNEILTGVYNWEKQLLEIGLAGQRSKNKHSKRSIPVHPQIEADLDFLSKNPIKYQRAARLFNKWANDAGLAPSISMQNLRTTFVTRLARIGVSRENNDILCGRKIRGSHSSYNRVRPEELRAEILKLDWHLTVPNW